MKLITLLLAAVLLTACASYETEAEYRAAGYCQRGSSWYPAATIIDLKAKKKIICSDGYWEPVTM